MTDRDISLNLAQRWARVSEEHNTERSAELLHDDFVMWYNFTNTERTKQEFLDTLKSAHAIFENQVNDDCKITLTDRGFVLQAVLRGVLDGQEIAAPYCLIAEVKDGKVIRGDEYFDTAQLPKRAGSPGEGLIASH
jgi:ketosteroid isomerase-like protein